MEAPGVFLGSDRVRGAAADKDLSRGLSTVSEDYAGVWHNVNLDLD